MVVVTWSTLAKFYLLIIIGIHISLQVVEIYYAVRATTWPLGQPFTIFPLILRHVSYPKGVVLGLQK